jgi:hypothetical protein
MWITTIPAMGNGFIEELVKNPWFQVSGFIVGVVGIALAILIWLVTRRYKRIWYDVRSFTLVERERSTVPGLQVFFEKKPVEALTISKICIWNSGKDAVRQQDFAPLRPLRISVTEPELEILEGSLIQTSSRNSSCKITRTSRNAYAVEFDFLDPTNGWVFQIAHTGTASEDVSVTGHIVGGGKISRPQPLGFLRHIPGKRLRPKTRRGRRIFAMWLLGLGAIFMIASAWGPRKEIGPHVLSKIVPLSFAFCYLVLAWTMYRIRPPKGLERYEDEFQGSDFSGPFRFPDAPQFASRREAADWVIAQVQAFAGKSHAEFKPSIISDNEINLDLGPYYWLTLDQINQIIAFGERHGFKVAVRGTSNNPFIPRELFKHS